MPNLEAIALELLVTIRKAQALQDQLDNLDSDDKLFSDDADLAVTGVGLRNAQEAVENLLNQHGLDEPDDAQVGPFGLSVDDDGYICFTSSTLDWFLHSNGWEAFDKGCDSDQPIWQQDGNEMPTDDDIMHAEREAKRIRSTSALGRFVEDVDLPQD